MTGMSATNMTTQLIKSAQAFDVLSDERAAGMSLVVENGYIREVSEAPIRWTGEAHTIDVAGRRLMPGLIDAHIHAYFSAVTWQNTPRAGAAHHQARAMLLLDVALDCGFTVEAISSNSRRAVATCDPSFAQVKSIRSELS
jgi:imidazolonepropionase-like amidohydrolase